MIAAVMEITRRDLKCHRCGGRRFLESDDHRFRPELKCINCGRSAERVPEFILKMIAERNAQTGRGRKRGSSPFDW